MIRVMATKGHADAAMVESWNSSWHAIVGVPVQANLTWADERLTTHRDVFGSPSRR